MSLSKVHLLERVPYSHTITTVTAIDHLINVSLLDGILYHLTAENGKLVEELFVTTKEIHDLEESLDQATQKV